jgi:hypothetical protein
MLGIIPMILMEENPKGLLQVKLMMREIITSGMMVLRKKVTIGPTTLEIGAYSIDGPSGAVDLYPFHTTGLTPFMLIIILAPVSIVLLGLLIYFIKRKRKIK